MSDLSDPMDAATRLEEAVREAALERHQARKRHASTFCVGKDCGVNLPLARQEYGLCIDCAAELEHRDRMKGYR